MSSSKPHPNGPVLSYGEAQAAQKAAETEALAIIKPRLFAALKTLGVVRAVLAFEGSGDSGAVDDITLTGEDEAPLDLEEQLKQVTITYPVVTSQFVPSPDPKAPAGYRLEVSEKTVEIPDAMEDVFWQLIEEHHGGWENGDGGYGECEFVPSEDAIRLKMNERYTETNYYEHEI